MKRALAGLGLALVACGGGQTRLGAVFSTDWKDDGGAGVRAVQARILATPIARSVPVAVGVTDEGLVGVGLAEGAAWSYAHAVDARPIVTGSVVVGAGGGDIFALDAATGRPLWTRRSGGALRGAGDDGRTTVLTLAGAGESGSVVLAVAHDGTVVRQLETAVAVGVPAVVGPFAFLPWQGQFVTIYNLQTGEEEARLLFREQVTRAMTHGGKLYFGELGLFRFDEDAWQASKEKASHVSLAAREIPGDPKWFRPGTEQRGKSSDAFDKIALYAAPSGSSPLAIDAGRFVATYYRIAAGFDAKTGAVAWARKSGADSVAGSAFDGGVALCDTVGQLTVVRSSDGSAALTKNLGRKVASCAVEADGLAAAHGSGDVTKSLAEQLADVIGAGDNEMAAMQKTLLRELAKLDDPKATKVLVDLASDGHTPEALMADVEKALASRRNGAEFMLASLKRHYDFLKDVLRPPPVGPLADALGAMKETRAAPALVSHLFDPADSTDAVRRVAAALADLATKV